MAKRFLVSIEVIHGRDSRKTKDNVQADIQDLLDKHFREHEGLAYVKVVGDLPDEDK